MQCAQPRRRWTAGVALRSARRRVRSRPRATRATRRAVARTPGRQDLDVALPEKTQRRLAAARERLRARRAFPAKHAGGNAFDGGVPAGKTFADPGHAGALE